MSDQLNTHKSEELVVMIAKKLGITADLGVKGKSGILKDQKTRAAFLADESHRIRFVYTPRHCSWLNQIEIWFSKLIRKLLNMNSFSSLEDLKNSISAFIEQHNESARAFKWTYRGIPLAA